MTSMFDYDDSINLAFDAKTAGKALVQAKHDLLTRTGEFLFLAHSDREFAYRCQMIENDIENVAVRKMSSVSDSKAKLVRALYEEWSLRHAHCVDCKTANADDRDTSICHECHSAPATHTVHGYLRVCSKCAPTGAVKASRQPDINFKRPARVTGSFNSKFASEYEPDFEDQEPGQFGEGSYPGDEDEPAGHDDTIDYGGGDEVCPGCKGLAGIDPSSKHCPVCNDSGEINFKPRPCKGCGGTGQDQSHCNTCNDTGIAIDPETRQADECPDCSNRGEHKECQGTGVDLKSVPEARASSGTGEQEGPPEFEDFSSEFTPSESRGSVVNTDYRDEPSAQEEPEQPEQSEPETRTPFDNSLHIDPLKSRHSKDCPGGCGGTGVKSLEQRREVQRSPEWRAGVRSILDENGAHDPALTRKMEEFKRQMLNCRGEAE